MKKFYLLAFGFLTSASLMATQVKVAAGADLQAAVDAANSGDTVLVQAGTYTGNFTMKDGVFVSGGWNEDFTAQTPYASVLDANQNGRVLNQPANFETLTIWDNFTIQNGKLAAAGSQNLGAGVALMKKGRVINCLIQNNTFDYSGNCIGGGLGHDTGDRNDTCAINCVVRNNQGSHGGGVRIRGVILNSVIEDNLSTTNAGGGMHLQAGAAYNCIIRNNESLKNTGGVRCYGACDLVNCLVAGNKAGGKVGGVGCESKPSNIINCTIVGNDQVNTGGDAVFCGLSDGIGDTNAHNGKFFVNNVIWGNTVNGEVQAVQTNAHIKRYSTFANNALSDTTDLGKEYFALAADNAAANGPQFVDSTYAFAWTSPLYNAGNNDSTVVALVGDKDVYGNVRKQGANIDLGAVEHNVYTAIVEVEGEGTLEVEIAGQKAPLAVGKSEVPAGFTAVLYATPAENYTVEYIILDEDTLEAVEGVYTIPAVEKDMKLKTIFDCTLTLFKVAAGEDLQLAVNKADTGDTVLVQAGTYIGNFTMKDGVFVSGGWNEDFTAQTEHASILDAQANGRVLNQPANFETLTIWDNFTIQNGKLDAWIENWGAGVALLKNGRVTNCLVQNNTFTYDSAKQCAGGGICNNSAGDTCAINCIVRNNKATHGGGIRTAGIAVNCVVENNETTNNGGGVYLHYKGELHNCIVKNNKSKDVGGVDMAAIGCAMYNCLIANNLATNVVGGVQVRDASNVVSCTVVGNDHNTTDDSRIVWAGMRFSAGATDHYKDKLFTNNIVWGNKHNGEVLAEQVHTYMSKYTVKTNNALQSTEDIDVEYIALAADNAAANGPQFVDSTYAFAWTSPLYNAGNNDALTYFVGDKDVYGNVRKQGANIDLGAVEHTVYTATVEAIENGTATLEFLGQSVSLAAGEMQVPEGFTANVVATPASGYVLDQIVLNSTALEAVEGVYTIPAVESNITLAIIFKQSTITSVENIIAAQVLAVYDMLGRQIDTTINDLTTGMYIVVTEQGTHKISIK